MPTKTGVARHHLRRVIRKHGDSASSVVAGHLYSLHEKIKWAKKEGFLERTKGSNGRPRYRLSRLGKYQFYLSFGHERSWAQLEPGAQRTRVARTIIEGAVAKYGVFSSFKSAKATARMPLNESLAGVIHIDLQHLQRQARNQLTIFQRERKDGTHSGVLPADIRRLRNTITIFQAVFDGLQNGTYSLER